METNNEQIQEIVEKRQFQITKLQYIFFGFFFSFFFTLILLANVSGDDYWWHVKVGEWIVQNKEIPTTGIFSWYALENNLSWFAHEWLAEVVLYFFTVLFGANGGIVYLILTLSLIGFLLYIFNKEGYLKHLGFSCVWVIFIFFGLMTVSTARPHMLTLSLFCILIRICEQIKIKENYNLYLLFPIISLFWANYHGGSSNIAYIIPIMYFITNSFNFTFGKIESVRVKKSYRYLLLAILNAITLVFNPRGFELYTYPYSYTNEHAKYISEWASPNFTNAPFAISIIIFICLIFFITTKKINFSDLALIGCFMLLTLKSIRFDAWLVIATTMVIFKYIKEMENKELYKWLSLEFGILGCLFFGYVCSIYNSGDLQIRHCGLSDEAIEILKTTEYDRLMNYYDYGSYLIYEEIDVFIDGRADMYSGHNFKQEVEGLTWTYEYGPKEFIAEFNFDMFCVPNDSYLSFYLQEHNEEYNELYSNEEVSIFQKIE